MAARTVHARISEAGSESQPRGWSGSAADAASERMRTIVCDADAVARALVTAAVAARGGCDRIATAQADVLARVANALAEGFGVADDGSVAPIAGDYGVRAATLTREIGDALDSLGEADADTAGDIDGPLASWTSPIHSADVVAGWPTMTGDQIARQIAAMTPAQRAQLIDEKPAIVGNTDGVPWISLYRSLGRHPGVELRGSTYGHGRTALVVRIKLHGRAAGGAS